MKQIFSKFKNIHFLWVIGILCFLTYYVPVKYYTDYVNYIPEWTLVFFISGAMVPLWFNELMWRSSSMSSSHYNMFHDLYSENKKWKTQTANIWLIITKYSKWMLPKKLFISMTSLTVGSLMYGFYVEYDEEFILPFTPYYVMNSFWWLYIITEFKKFKLDVEMGFVRYGKVKRTGPKTHFMEEWVEEERRIKSLEDKRKNKRNND
jgi:hypothetical protein